MSAVAQWELAFLVPGANMKTAVEADPVVLAPSDDARLIEVTRRTPAVGKLLSSFTDQFGRPIQPAAILVKSVLPKTVDYLAVAAFRNIVALSSVFDARCRAVRREKGYAVWSDHFDFYPYTVDKSGEGIVGRSLAMQSLDEPEEFTGQSAAHLPAPGHISFGLDTAVLKPLLRQWRRKFVLDRPERTSTVLFRSLHVACAAARMPAVGNQVATIYDAGLAVAHWVSSLEILTHPKPKQGNASLKTVVDLLQQIDWQSPVLRAKRFRLRQVKQHIRFVERLYGEVYRARNDFLHGNRVGPDQLHPFFKRSAPSLLDCAPLIYRVALSQFLTPVREARAKHRHAFFLKDLSFEEAFTNVLKRSRA
jgi:hypothetical protein